MQGPIFEVTGPALGAEDRRLASVEAIRGALPVGDATADATLAALIDDVSATMARFANLAADAGGTPPTFASEEVRSTWLATRRERSAQLILPWRVPITAIVSVVESGIALDPDTDFRLTTGGILLRLVDDTPAPWSIGKIVVEYRAGWELPDGAPTDLKAAVAEQVKYRLFALDRDPAVRSESVPDVYSASYAAAGGDSVGASGLLIQVEAALAPYRAISV